MNLESLLREQKRQQLTYQTRRHFLRDGMTGLGGLWLATQGRSLGRALDIQHSQTNPLDSLPAQFAPKAKRVIFLHMVGAPSTLDLFHYKPELAKYNGQECPASFLEGERFAFIQGVPRMLGPQFDFKQYGQSGAYVSDQLPHLSKHVDDLCFIHTLKTDQFNHGPAQLVMQTGSSALGHGSIGSWATWGLGTENENLPGFMVLLSGGRRPRAGNALWSAGHLPSVYQGVQCRSVGEPVLNTTNPRGVSHQLRGQSIQAINEINRKSFADIGDPETLTRIAQYEMAFRMQTSVPEVMDISNEPDHIHEMYGTRPGKESFANNCLLARRLSESGVRFVQLYDWGWDSHGAGKNEALNHGFQDKCRSIDQPVSALLTDLKQRGLLDETLVIWGGEFGRTPMQENRGGGKMAFIGRDHNPNSATIWMAGGGVKPGISYGETDLFGYKPLPGQEVHVRDFQATVLNQLGFDHKKLSINANGLDQKLTGVKKARVIKDILA
ncbi:DUF1501 domain-containing protein [Roseibacillus persicicus]|uniref:DUF1501 domain-containing protein n=1 Tax=Roseibacillus persicicus TaxID=454148 RepID=UPI00280E5124|nr:DUF1501 domain-containing protein [Roseibacillus persicicus]MDQ8190366.1 DUF1501 domain-containing protein [Roseibacillus persicicus]